MPFISVKTNVSITETGEEQLRKKLGNAISSLPGKSEQWLMLDLHGNQHMAFAGTTAPCAMVRVMVYGKADASSYEKLTEEVMDILHEELQLSSDRIYIAYTETDLWGWNGSNF